MRISSITKNAGKACNNRLYRHIRTFEKIVKNYFVIYHKYASVQFLITLYTDSYKSPIPKVNSLNLMPKMSPFKGTNNFKAVFISYYVKRRYSRCKYTS